MTRIVRHRKLSAAALSMFEHEADLILERKPYKTLAEVSGLSLGSVQQIMAQLLRERREELGVVHRGTQLVDVDALATSAMMRPSEGP